MEQKRKTVFGISRPQERELSAAFGKHVSSAKALLCVVASTLVCLSPMLLGIRVWNEIPAVVETGLVTADGRDDSLPRAVLVYGIPGVFALLNLICHGQLWLHQKTQRLPPSSVRLLGRWSIACIGLFLSSFWITRASGDVYGADVLLPCLLSMLLILLGAHFFDCTRESLLAFHLKSIEHWETPWRKTHRLAGLCWTAAGLLLLLVFFGTGTLPWYSFACTLILLFIHFPAASRFAGTDNKKKS